MGKIGKARDYLTSGEVAQRLGRPRRTITYQAKKGELPTRTRLGREGHYRYPLREIQELAQSPPYAGYVGGGLISVLKDNIRALRQGLAQQQAYSILRGDWVELEDTPPPEI